MAAVLRRFAVGWSVAGIGFALGGAITAVVAIVRAQYPMLGPGEALALVARWAASGGDDGSLRGRRGRLPHRVGAPARRSPLLVAIAGTLAAGALLYATRGSEPTAQAVAPRSVPPVARTASPAGDRPNLVLVTIDTLRADHLDLYGYARETAPSLRDFAAGGAVFETDISQAPATQLSMASLLTGRLALVARGCARAAAGRRAVPARRLRDARRATRRRRLGHGRLRRQHRACASPKATRRASGTGTSRLPRSARAASSSCSIRRSPGSPAPASRSSCGSTRSIRTIPINSPIPLPGRIRTTPPSRRFRAAWEARSVWEQTERLDAVLDGPQLEPGETAYLVGRYDAEIRHADAGLARLFAALRARGADDSNTLVIVTADHGEEFLDHGGMLHSRSLFDELLHVPLVVRGVGVPAGPAHRGQVRGVDVAATLLDAAGVPASDLDGRSLAPFWTHAGAATSRPALSSREGKYLAYRSDGEKLVVAMPRYPATEPPARHRGAAVDDARRIRPP